MIIGIDFDNTIIDYNPVFTKLLDVFDIKDNQNNPKSCLKNYLISNYGEISWTKIQGLIYGPLSFEAKLFPGFVDFLQSFSDRKIVIVSHRTYKSTGFNDINLIKYGYEIYEKLIVPLNFKIEIYFEETEQDKINRINSIGCNIFIDDLERVLLSLFQVNKNIHLFHYSDIIANRNNGSYEQIIRGNWDNIGKIVKGFS
jgi:hypothetical protein